MMESKDRTKAMWQLINRVTGKAEKENVKLELRIGDQITAYAPQHYNITHSSKYTLM
jgi:hypothetical protein